MRLSLKRHGVVGGAMLLLILGLAVAVVTAGGIVVWEYSNSNAFCATMCHSVHPEETRAHGVSSHARVECVECHMGRISTLHMMALKPTHAHELWGMIVGYERPLASRTLRPARDNCEGCHWPSIVHRDSISIKKRYDTDKESSETAYRLTLHTGMGAIRDAAARGIHWHIENEVLFYSPDIQRRTIPWVQVRTPDGKTVTYVDVENPPTPEDLKKHEPRRMECFDCHNSVGHPFKNPEDLVDDAIAAGRIDRTLPSIKARAVALIGASAKLSGNPQDLAPQYDKLIAEAAPKGELKPEMAELEKKFAAEMKAILLRTSFTRPELNWQSFPNHAGHKDFPGCFRCHNGKHLNEAGEAIRLQCTLCHDLPQVVREKGKGSVPSTVAAGLTPPPSHEEPNFMHDHRTKLDDTCTMCHGKIEWGQEGGSFCSNPACHGRKWPEMSLDPQAKK